MEIFREICAIIGLSVIIFAVIFSVISIYSMIFAWLSTIKTNKLCGIPDAPKIPRPPKQRSATWFCQRKGLFNDEDMEPRPDTVPGSQGRSSHYEKDPCADCVYNKHIKDKR